MQLGQAESSRVSTPDSEAALLAKTAGQLLGQRLTWAIIVSCKQDAASGVQHRPAIPQVRKLGVCFGVRQLPLLHISGCAIWDTHLRLSTSQARTHLLQP